jgi:nucleoside phosphorylase
MSQEKEIVLSAEVLLETTETLTLEIESVTRGIERKTGLEGKITFNPQRCLIYFIPPISNYSAMPYFSPDRNRWDLYLIIIPYTLHQASKDQYYEEMTFFVEMANPKVTAFDLFPKTIATKVEETKVYTLSPQFKFCEVQAGLGGIGRQLRFDVLRPGVAAFGEGESTFYWVHKSFKEQKIIPETKHAMVVLQVPHNMPSVKATISYEVISVRKLLGVWKTSHGETEPYTFRWQLQGSPSFFLAPEKSVNDSPFAVSTESFFMNPQKSLKSSFEPSVATDKSSSFDVCILCALAEEAEAFIHIADTYCGTSSSKAFSHLTNSEYYQAVLHNSRNEALRMHISWAPHYGPVEAGLYIKPVLDYYRPRFAVMTGICAGDKRKVRLGDLVIADRAFIYDSGKIALDKAGYAVLQPDLDIWHSDQHTIQFARMFDAWKTTLARLPRPISKQQQRDWLLNMLLTNTAASLDDIPKDLLQQYAPDWQKILPELQEEPEQFLTRDKKLRDRAQATAFYFAKAEFPYRDPAYPACYIAAMASGSTVRMDVPFDRIQQAVRSTIAIDMEGAVFYRAIADFSGIRSLLVKGVCDYTDKDKDDTYHQYAAAASALYALRFIEAYVTSERF